MLRDCNKTKRLFLSVLMISFVTLGTYILYTSSRLTWVVPSTVSFRSSTRVTLADTIFKLLKVADSPVKMSVVSKSLRAVPPPTLPGDSNLSYADDRSLKITKRPVDLYREIPADKDNIDPNNPPLKKILFWNDAYSGMHYGFGFGREPFLRAGCRVNTCMTTSNRSRFPIKEIDALMWHFRSNDRSLPNTRSPHTRYVFWMMESASYLYGNLQIYKNVFNWTFTYRLDSDFPNPYGQVFRRQKPLPVQQRNYAANKTKLVAWFVSNCMTQSGRETLAKNLRKFIEVDQYGACGLLRCDRQHEEVCLEMLNKKYKFYLAFENSLCRDYVTEKFFNKLSLDVVPVVYGGANYSQHAPPHSYIDALSFPTAKALADYLIYLNKNDTAYNEYFRWKRFHQLIHGWATVSRPFCDLCERLHTDTSTSVYDLQRWFADESRCRTFESKDIAPFINGLEA
ncbi:hypothetical protein OTU49_007147 [Cherax quadricarinatus]|uniref:Fucosyltransferase n=1 Tax=Cherax quadricarinatus TaxID=27406 RepID=A0AAW0WWP8_CHEQU